MRINLYHHWNRTQLSILSGNRDNVVTLVEPIPIYNATLGGFLSESHKDIFARTISVLALLTAIAAIVVPYIQQQSQFRALHTEQLKIRINSFVSEPLLVTSYDHGEDGGVVQTPWKISISNNGNRKSSVVMVSAHNVKTNGNFTFAGVTGDILSMDHTPVELPINLGPGESQSYYLSVGFKVPKEVYHLLGEVGKDSRIPLNIVTNELSKIGIDLYGFPLRFSPVAGGGVKLEADSRYPPPIIEVVVKTGLGNYFAGRASRSGFFDGEGIDGVIIN